MKFKVLHFSRTILTALNNFKNGCESKFQGLKPVFMQNAYVSDKKSRDMNEIREENRRKIKEIAATSIYKSQSIKPSRLTTKPSPNPFLAIPVTYADIQDKSKKKGGDKVVQPPKRAEKLIVKVYRYDGINSLNSKPRMSTFEIKKVEGRMILDLLIQLKKMDPTLTFRRSCREGICGSCAVNVQGSNCLSCLTMIPKAKVITIYPIPHMYVIRDLCVDMSHFLAAYNSVRPYLIRKSAPKLGEMVFAQSVNDQVKLDGLYECILCACCSTSCPSYWWNGRRFLGPAALLQTYRWVIDSRDEGTKERLQALRDDFKIFRCHTILNCVLDCPKKLSPGFAIAKLKRLVSGLDSKPPPELPPMKFKDISHKWLTGLGKYE